MLGARVGSMAVTASLLTVLLVGCGGSAATSNVTPITRAAYVTTAGPGFKVAATVTVSREGRTFTLAMDGAVGWPGPRGQMTVRAAGKHVEEIFDFPSYYVRAPGKRFNGKPWGKVDVAGALAALGGGSFGTGASDITHQLGYLRAAGSATRLGADTLRGDPTTHYRVVVDLSRYLSVVPKLERGLVARSTELLERATGQTKQTLDVWVDRGDRIRRVEAHESVCTPEGKLDGTTNTEIYGFGRQAVAPVPPAAEVADLSSSVDKAFKQALEKLHC